MDLITTTQQDLFLAHYRQTGLFQQAARTAGTTKQEIERYCKKETADAETFALNLQAANDDWADVVRKEVTRRAIDGVEEAVYYKGDEVGTKTVYSDTLLSKMAEAILPEFKKAAEQPQAAISIQINTFGDKAQTVIIDELPSLE
jgi:transcriptional regulator